MEVIIVMPEDMSEADRAFAQVLAWLIREREEHQQLKYDYADDDLAHARDGLGDDSWFWTNGVLNYTGRVRLHGVETQQGAQALMKLGATILAQAEHLVRGGLELPKPGLSSGNIEPWD